MKIELNDYGLEIVTAVIRLQRVMLSPVPSNEIQRDVLRSIEGKLENYLAKTKGNRHGK